MAGTLGVLIALIIGSVACDSARDDDPPARIVPGESVEGIPLGASKAEAEAVLGEFGTQCRADGLDRTWCTAFLYMVNTDDSLGLSLGFIAEWSPEGFWREGPLDFFWINPPYDGTTNEGIGIGSSRAEVLTAFGPPDSVLVRNGYSKYFFCFGHGRRMSFTIKSEAVARMHIGYFRPMPNGVRICD